MPRCVSKKVKIRSTEAYKLIRRLGCITTRNIMDLGFTHSQALNALRYLERNGIVVHVKIGDMWMWCRSRKSAVKRLRELKNVLHEAICKAGIKYVTVKRAFGAIMNNDTAKQLFSRYIILDIKNPATKRFINGLLMMTYGNALYRKGDRTPVYFADCGKRPKPLPPGILRDKKEYRTISFRVDKELEEDLKRAAKIEGISISALVRRTIEGLLSRYFNTRQ